MIRSRLPQPQTLDKAQPRDMFKTPNYATKLLMPYIPKYIEVVWECACGEDEKISNVLKDTYFMICTDIVYGQNFITDKFDYVDQYSDKIAIITNPPFSLKQKFFKKCIEYDVPFALLISSDYSAWTIDAIRKYGCQKLVPDRRIDYITPTGLTSATGHTSYFHSMWLTRGFDLTKSETFVCLTKEMKEDI